MFGNMGETSAIGGYFSRDAGTGEDLFNGEYLINAQDEDGKCDANVTMNICPWDLKILCLRGKIKN